MPKVVHILSVFIDFIPAQAPYVCLKFYEANLSFFVPHIFESPYDITPRVYIVNTVFEIFENYCPVYVSFHQWHHVSWYADSSVFWRSSVPSHEIVLKNSLSDNLKWRAVGIPLIIRKDCQKRVKCQRWDQCDHYVWIEAWNKSSVYVYEWRKIQAVSFMICKMFTLCGPIVQSYLHRHWTKLISFINAASAQLLREWSTYHRIRYTWQSWPPLAESYIIMKRQ